MWRMYWPCLLAATAFVAWAHVHTDEVPVVFGFLLVLGVALGAAFPRRFVVSWLVLGTAVPLMEILVHFAWVHAPYGASPLSAIPLIALVALAPPLVGVGVGAGMR
jgi:hypothetical protein